jgi:membrane protein
MNRNLQKSFNILKYTINEFRFDFCLQKAAALTFASIFALIPIITLSFSIFTSFNAFNNTVESVQNLIIKHFIPSTSSKIVDYLMLYSHKTQALNFLSIVFLIITSVSLFNTIENSFNAIFRIKLKRPIANKLAYSWSILTLTPLLIAASIYLSASIMKNPMLKRIFDFSYLRLTFRYSIPLILTWFAFFLAYLLLPYTKISLNAALKASFVSGSLWEFAKYGFDFYISHVPTYDMIFGSLSIIPIFLLWVYYSWIIVLFGAELAFVLHKPYKSHDDRIVTIRSLDMLGLRVLYYISKHFLSSDKKATCNQLAKDTDSNFFEVNEILDTLIHNKLISKIDDENYEYIPAKPLNKIKLFDVFKLFKGGVFSFDESDIDFIEREILDILIKLKNEFGKIFENLTIDDMFKTK